MQNSGDGYTVVYARFTLLYSLTRYTSESHPSAPPRHPQEIQKRSASASWRTILCSGASTQFVDWAVATCPCLSVPTFWLDVCMYGWHLNEKESFADREGAVKFNNSDVRVLEMILSRRRYLEGGAFRSRNQKILQNDAQTEDISTRSRTYACTSRRCHSHNANQHETTRKTEPTSLSFNNKVKSSTRPLLLRTRVDSVKAQPTVTKNPKGNCGK